MNNNDIKEKLKQFICENLGVEKSILTDDLQLFDGGICLDSIDSIEIISYVNEEFNVSIAGADRKHFIDVKSLASYIESNL